MGSGPSVSKKTFLHRSISQACLALNSIKVAINPKYLIDAVSTVLNLRVNLL